MAGDSAGPSELTDVDRSGIAVVANLIAIIAFLLADGVCLHWPAEWGSARWVVHTGCVIFALYFLIVAGGWRSFVGSMRRARAENGGSARGGPGQFTAVSLHIGAILNFIVVCAALILTGGTRSPFMAYPGGFILFTQFLANTGRTVYLSLAAGVVVVTAVAWVPAVVAVADQHAVAATIAGKVAVRSAFGIVSLGAIGVGTMCTARRKTRAHVPHNSSPASTAGGSIG